jgi:hypothetical protein
MPQQEEPQSDPTELRRRLVGRADEQRAEEIEFWRHAGDRVRADTLYALLARGEAIRAAIPYTRQEQERLILRPGGREIRRIE